MKKWVFHGVLALSLLLPFNTPAVSQQLAKSEVKQVCIIKDGLYDNHNAFVDESKYSLDSVLESVELLMHNVKYSISYETLDGRLYSLIKEMNFFGTGIVIEKKEGKAYILTNDHLIRDEIPSEIPPNCKWIKINKITDELYIVKGEGESHRFIEAEKLVSDQKLDVALLETDDSSNFTKFPYKIGNSDDLRVGDFIWVIGAPLGLVDYTLEGNISKVSYSSNPDWFMIGSDVQKGYSGGAIVAIRDGEYELVGLVVATLVRPGEIIPDVLSGYGIAIKINPAMKIVEDYFDNLKK